MPRTPAHSSDEIIYAAMLHFWQNGYHATSMDDLVTATGVNRHAIYSGIGGKSELYRRGFTAYRAAVVTPAFSAVEQVDAGLAAIGGYFEFQIARAEAAGLPASGCLVANATTETAPHDPQIADEVAAHNARLKAGFAHALANENCQLPRDELETLADFLVVSAQGLWSMSRTVISAAPLRAHVSTILSLLHTRLRHE
jgi:TetR/AcrR family transcriptional regulator, transcriptional repressor for nem operon